MIETIIIISVVSFIVGWKLSQAWHLLSFRHLLKDLNVTDNQLKQVAKDNGIEIEELKRDLPEIEVIIEKQPEGLFAYRKDNSLFLASGQDREELMKNLVNNLTNVRVIVAKEDGADYINAQK